jgi:hypothetical protein
VDGIDGLGSVVDAIVGVGAIAGSGLILGMEGIETLISSRDQRFRPLRRRFCAA